MAELKNDKSIEANKSHQSNYDAASAISYNKRLGKPVSYWKTVQSKLNSDVPSKPNLVTDGIPGKLTTDAVYQFQSYNGMSLKDGKFGPMTSAALFGSNDTNNSNNNNNNNNKVQDTNEKVTIPSGTKIMSVSYTPDLDLLNRHASQEGYQVKSIDQSANYVAKYCTGNDSQHQCTRGTSLFLQLASYARGEANRTYKSSCAAHLFGSANALTNYNISSSVAGEYAITSANSKTGKSNMNAYIANNLKKDGDFVTFKYASSQHIVFHSGGKWYSDFKQGTATGCGNENTVYSNVHFFTM